MYYRACFVPPNLPFGDSVFAMYKDIDLTNPKLGAKARLRAQNPDADAETLQMQRFKLRTEFLAGTGPFWSNARNNTACQSVANHTFFNGNLRIDTATHYK